MIYLGIDCGTQSTKTVAFDEDTRRIVASAAESYDVLPGLPQGHMEQNPATWIQALEATVTRVLADLGARRTEVRGIGVSGQQHGFVSVDAKGEVIRPAKLWCDTSTGEECDLLREKLGGREAVINRLGIDMLPGFTAPKILWMKRHEKENFARLKTVLLPHDYLNWFLTGNARMEFGDASGMALMDIQSRTWSVETLQAIDSDLAEKMPALGSSRKPVGSLKRELLKRWGLSHEVVVSAGGGDNMMSAIGTSNVKPGRITASLGTSGTIYAYSEKAVIDPDGEVAGFCDSTDAYLPLICTMNVTVATEAVRKLFGWSHGEMEKAIQTIPAGAEGLLFLPYLQGERTPNLPQGTGVFHGLTTRTMTPAHLARATMEGVTLGLAYGLNRLRSLKISPTEIRLTGGGSKSAIWRQICADVFNCRVVTMAEAEGAALGAAIQALAAVQTEKSIGNWADDLVAVNQGEAVEPQNAQVYQELAEKQKNLTNTLSSNHYL
jgi:xylulokinase